MTPGNYDFATARRGDTLPAWQCALTDTETDDPIAISSARMQVRKRGGAGVVLEWSTADGTLTITGAGDNVLTLAEKSASAMESAETGTHTYDIEVVLAATGHKATILSGKYPIAADITRP